MTVYTEDEDSHTKSPYSFNITAYRANRPTLKISLIVNVTMTNPCESPEGNPFDMDLPTSLAYHHDIFSGEALTHTKFALFTP
jgi:hypothetical protein